MKIKSVSLVPYWMLGKYAKLLEKFIVNHEHQTGKNKQEDMSDILNNLKSTQEK